ncbi:MAG: hypothetical protein AAF716_16645 [Cyanobacteria bacterium P01_D01_bin.1]
MGSATDAIQGAYLFALPLAEIAISAPFCVSSSLKGYLSVKIDNLWGENNYLASYLVDVFHTTNSNMLEIAAIADSVTRLLAPVLPYLVKLSDQASQEAAKKVGPEAWDRAKNVWAKLKPLFGRRPSVQEAVNDIVEEPDNEDAQAAFRQQLRKILKGDEALRAELSNLLSEELFTGQDNSVKVEGGGVAFGAHSAINISGTVSGGDIKV